MTGKKRRGFGLRSIRAKLIVAFVLVGLPPALILGGLADKRSHAMLVGDSGERLRVAAENVIDKIDRDLGQRYSDVQAFAAVLDPSASEEELVETANRLIQTYDVYDIIIVADQSGTIVAVNDQDLDGFSVYTSHLRGMDVRGMDWFDAASSGAIGDGESYFSDLVENDHASSMTGTRELSLVFSAPSRDESGQITHVWSTRASPVRIINEILAEQLDAFRESGASTIQVELISPAGVLLSSGSVEDADEILRQNLVATGLESARLAADGGRGYVAEVDPESGDEQIIGYASSIGARNFDGNGWAVLVRQDVREATRKATALKNYMLLIVITSGIAMVLFAMWVARSFSRPITDTVRMLHNIAQGDGDLTQRLDIKSSDEIGELATLFNSFVDNLHGIIAEIRDTAGNVLSASEDMTGASAELSEGAQQQATSLEETAASLEEITATVKQTADNAEGASKATVDARSIADKGGTVVAEAVDAMSGINDSSKKISEIISTINEIAFQTNLLAINAATEAARAGEQGRGFAVVAAEVRNLAQRSGEAAREIKQLIDDSVRRVEGGTVMVNNSGKALTEIVEAVSTATVIVAEIAAACREQSSGIEEVNRAVTNMDRTTQTNATQTEHVSGTADGLSHQARRLEELVGRFRLSDEANDRHEARERGGSDRFQQPEGAGRFLRSRGAAAASGSFTDDRSRPATSDFEDF